MVVLFDSFASWLGALVLFGWTLVWALVWVCYSVWLLALLLYG